MSALFVMPPGGVIPHFSEHLGTAFLRTMLARAGIQSRQLLPDRNLSLGGFARLLEDLGPRIVGFTAYETNLRACRAMARAVRESLPEAIVVVGGPNATFSPEETLELLGADLCVRGAGEGTIVAIVRAILGTEGPRRRLPELLADLPNLVIRERGGARRTRLGDLSSFPGEHFGCLDDIPSPYQSGQIATPDVGLLTARGCNQHCTYCSFAAVSGRRVHYHAVERVLDDLAALKAIASRTERRRASIPILDDAFTLAPRRARAICEGIVRRGLQMPFDCETRADRVDAGLLRLMRRAGFVRIAFGLESGVPRVLRAIGKVQDPATPDDPEMEAERAYLEAFRAAVAAAKKAGLSPAVSVIGGLPGESADDFRSTLALVESLRVPVYAHNVLVLAPGTPLYRDRERYGLGAARDPVAGAWRTHHAYDVGSVRPLRNSLTHADQWDEANEISDALCGWPRHARAGEGAVWAVVLHGEGPDAGVAAWLREVLAVHGAVVVVSEERPRTPSDHAAWLGVLGEAGVPCGLLAVLSGDGAPDGTLVLRSIGTQGEHRFEIDSAWHTGGRAVEADDAGHCRVSVWVASGATAPPPAAGDECLRAPTQQVADGCRFWSGWRRCSRPTVLHVWRDSTVSACWRGPAIGRVGDAYADLVVRGRALGRADGAASPAADRCPLASAGGEGAAAVETYDVAAQLSWLLRRQADARRRQYTKEGGPTWQSPASGEGPDRRKGRVGRSSRRCSPTTGS